MSGFSGHFGLIPRSSILTKALEKSKPDVYFGTGIAYYCGGVWRKKFIIAPTSRHETRKFTHRPEAEGLIVSKYDSQSDSDIDGAFPIVLEKWTYAIDLDEKSLKDRDEARAFFDRAYGILSSGGYLRDLIEDLEEDFEKAKYSFIGFSDNIVYLYRYGHPLFVSSGLSSLYFSTGNFHEKASMVPNGNAALFSSDQEIDSSRITYRRFEKDE